MKLVSVLNYCKNLTSNNQYIKKMAQSKFEYVKNFENEIKCLPNCWIIIRVDGKNFSKFTDTHKFIKPNDIRALELMNTAAKSVMKEYNDVILSFGQSDEYSFVLKKNTELYNRREFKLVTNINSLFTSSYVFNWSKHFSDVTLKYPPSFDARVVLYPTNDDLRNYLSWRQADVHINNLYNTCFWNLVQRKNMTPQEAQETLKPTLSADKNEILFQEFGINYNNELQIYRKGTTLIRKKIKNESGKSKVEIVALSESIIDDKFWIENPHLLGELNVQTVEEKRNNRKNLKEKINEES